MAKSTPLVSVIIPTYNWSTVLPYSIGSVLRQEFTQLEVLVIGDGCTDNSEAVVKGIGDKRVRWLNLPANTGHQTGPNNEGLRLARGSVIAYLGHDDLWLPHHLTCLLAALKGGADVAYGVTKLIGPEGKFFGISPVPQAYQRGMWLPPTGLIHHRKVTDAVGGWRHYRGMDVHPEVDLLRRAHEGDHAFAFVPRFTAIKFPAAWRRDSYKTRPYHEQAAWLARIQNEPDLEATQLAKMLLATEEKRRERHNEEQQRLQGQLAANHNIDDKRRFKGLERLP
jgi:glycosyltransferase involved in cell wall biosynthesis